MPINPSTGKTDFKILVNDRQGAGQAEISDFLSLSYTRIVNAPGILLYTTDGDHAHIDDLEHLGIIEVLRKPYGATGWTSEFEAFYEDFDYVGYNPATFTGTCLGVMEMLAWPVVLWTANTSDRSSFSAEKAETIMKTLVEYNATSDATTGNGREYTYPVTVKPRSGLTIQTDGTKGSTIDIGCAWANLLETLQNIARIGGGDFDVVNNGTAAWEFQWFTDQLGQDASSDVTFSVGNGTMKNPRYYRQRINEKSIAIVGGPGQESDREITTRTGTNYSAVNHKELFIDSSDLDTAAAREDRGDEYLDAAEAVDVFTFDLDQTVGLQYRTDYDLGYLVNTVNPYTGDSATHKIMQITVTKERGKDTENISVVTEAQ